MYTLNLVRLALAILFIAGGLTKASGEDYPSRSVQLMIPSSKGGGADVSFRVLALAMESLLGQKIEIVNRPADSGAEGLAELANAAPDGYSLGAVWNGPLTASPQMRQLPYSLGSFTPIASTFESDFVLCVHKDFPAATGQELIQLLRQKPLAYSYSNEGKGGSGYFAAERLFDALGILVRGQSFNGSGEAGSNFAARAVDLYAGTTPAIMTLIRSGEAKCLVVMAKQRPAFLPQASTVSELGAPGLEASLWRLIVAPKGIPEDRVAKLEAVIRKAMASPAMHAFLSAQGERQFVQDGPETMARLKEEFVAFSTIASRLGIKAY